MPLVIRIRRPGDQKVVQTLRLRHNSEDRGEIAIHTVVHRATRRPRDLALPSQGVPAVVMVPTGELVAEDDL